MPLLAGDSTAVPFVCRYRVDIIHPLSNQDIHRLSTMLQTHRSLESLRNRIMEHVGVVTSTNKNDDNNNNNKALKERVATSISKSELEDLYAPYKPPSKGSLEDRIRQQHPDLIPKVDTFWNDARQPIQDKRTEEIVTLLANKIASDTSTTDALLEYVSRYARIQTSKAAIAAKGDASLAEQQEEHDKKYSNYYDFSVSFSSIRDHQVLAIRRGVQQKALKLSYDIDGDRTESRIRRCLLDQGIQRQGVSGRVWNDAVHDAWTRLLRKRITTRLWKDQCNKAEEHSIQVFCDNLIRALLMPPLERPTTVLALDPGFKAGIKTALLDKNGKLLLGDADTSLSTVQFLGNSRKRGVEHLISLLQIVYSAQEEEDKDDTLDTAAKATSRPGGRPKKKMVTVALGNGHGSQIARDLVREASDKCGIPIDIQLVNEAGASVWSVTEGASREFPDQQAAVIAAVCIGRRYQNPLPELVKIPPRSLGLGMYQHDLSEKDLDEKLAITSVQAVAEVGVDGNACSQEILERIPGLTKTLCERIIQARPLRTRQDLLKITGLGAKTFENCAAFIRIEDGEEALDSTLVHPESYELAKYLLKQLKWNLKDKSSIRRVDIPKSKEARIKLWGSIMEKAAAKYNVTMERVSSVMDHLVVSITNPDPRLSGKFSIIGSTPTAAASSSPSGKVSDIGSIDGCSLLPSHMSTSLDALRKACPLRGIVATVRNVVDFGAFVDIGSENDGLLHRSNLGRVPLSSLLVGQEIGVDVLKVSDNGRIAIGLAGLDLKLDPDFSEKAKTKTKAKAKANTNSGNGKRSYSTNAAVKPLAKRQRTAKKINVIDLSK